MRVAIVNRITMPDSRNRGWNTRVFHATISQIAPIM